MSFTLKKKKSNMPFFIQEDGKTLSLEPSNSFLEYNTLNDLAIDLVNKKYSFEDIYVDWVISRSDVVSLNSKKQIKKIANEQDLNHSVKLINIDHLSYVNRGRVAKMYLKNLRLELNNPIVEELELIQISKEDDLGFKKGDKLIACSNYSCSLITGCFFEIIDDVNLEELNENRNINTEKCSYFIVSRIKHIS